MNNKIILLVTLIFITITINMINLYFSSTKQLTQNYDNFLNFQTKTKQLNYYKNKYSTKSLKILNHFCKIKHNQITCKNLSPKKLKYISKFLKSNIIIQEFEISNNNSKINFNSKILR